MSDTDTRATLTLVGVDRTAAVIENVGKRLNQLSNDAAAANDKIGQKLDLSNLMQGFSVIGRATRIFFQIGQAINEHLNKPLKDAVAATKTAADALTDAYTRIHRARAADAVSGFKTESTLTDMSERADEVGLRQHYRQRQVELEGQFDQTPVGQAQKGEALVKLRAEEESNLLQNKINWEKQRQAEVAKEMDTRKATVKAEEEQLYKDSKMLAQVQSSRTELQGGGLLPEEVQDFFFKKMGGDPRDLTNEGIDKTIDSFVKMSKESERIVEGEKEQIKSSEETLRISRAKVEAYQQEQAGLVKVTEAETAAAEAATLRARDEEKQKDLEKKRKTWRELGADVAKSFSGEDMASMVLGGSYDAAKAATQRQRDSDNLRSMLSELRRLNEAMAKQEAV